MYKLLGFVFGICLFAACASEPNEQKTLNQEKYYSLRLDDLTSMGQVIQGNIISDLPDKTQIHFTCDRPYYRINDSISYAGRRMDSKFILINGAIQFKFEINDRQWQSEYEKLIEKLPDDMAPLDYQVDSLYLSAVVNPLYQNNDIKLTLGNKGENLLGSDVQDLNGIKILKADTMIYMPVNTK